MLEEIVTVVDASGRDVIREAVRSVPLLPVPSLFRALAPALSDKDKQVVTQIRTLIQFLFGNFDSAFELQNSNPNLSRIQRAQSILRSNRLRSLTPILREYTPQLREFGTLLVARLTEKGLSRGLNWASTRLGPVL